MWARLICMSNCFHFTNGLGPTRTSSPWAESGPEHLGLISKCARLGKLQRPKPGLLNIPSETVMTWSRFWYKLKRTHSVLSRGLNKESVVLLSCLAAVTFHMESSFHTLLNDIVQGGDIFFFNSLDFMGHDDGFLQWCLKNLLSMGLWYILNLTTQLWINYPKVSNHVT